MESFNSNFRLFTGKFCLKDYFACRTIKYKYMHWCLEFSDLCDGLGFCDSKKDEACDDNLHIPTGICRGESDSR